MLLTLSANVCWSRELQNIDWYPKEHGQANMRKPTANWLQGQACINLSRSIQLPRVFAKHTWFYVEQACIYR